jgi:hypothetical protein
MLKKELNYKNVTLQNLIVVLTTTKWMQLFVFRIHHKNKQTLFCFFILELIQYTTSVLLKISSFQRNKPPKIQKI